MVQLIKVIWGSIYKYLNTILADTINYFRNSIYNRNYNIIEISSILCQVIKIIFACFTLQFYQFHDTQKICCSQNLICHHSDTEYHFQLLWWPHRHVSCLTHTRTNRAAGAAGNPLSNIYPLLCNDATVPCHSVFKNPPTLLN